MSASSHPEIRAAIGAVPLFHGISESLRVRLLERSRLRSYRRHQSIFEKGDPADGVFAIIRGYCKASSPDPRGGAAIFSIMGPREVFGELGVIDGAPRSASVVALGSSDLVVIESEVFRGLVEGSHSMSLALLKSVCARLRQLSERVEDRDSMPVDVRLARMVTHIADRFGTRLSGRHVVSVPLSQQDLGELIGASREHVNKALRKWQRDGVIGPPKLGRFVIEDIAALRSVGG